MSKALSRAAADRLLNEIRTGLVNIEKLIVKAIDGRAWEALGYETFTQMWTDRMQGVRLATDVMKAAVVYAAFDSDPGATVDSVAKAFDGVDTPTVQKIKRQKDDSVPAHLVSTRRAVTGALTKPSTIRAVIVRVPHRHFVKMKAEAGDYASLEKLAREALYDTMRARGVRGISR